MAIAAFASALDRKTPTVAASYLGNIDFARAMALALLTHVLALTIFALWPREQVEQIPVRALSFRLGEARVLLPPEPITPPQPPAQEKIAEKKPEEPVVKKQEAPKPKEKPPAPEVKKVEPEPVRQAPVENIESGFLTSPARYMPAEQLAPEAAEKRSLLERAPKEYIRKYGLPTVDSILKDGAPKPTIKELTEVKPTVLQGAQPVADSGASQVKVVEGSKEGAAGKSTSEEEIQIIRQRYEQQISAWIIKHKIYPPSAAGKQGRVVVRMRIDRQGYVRYYALEEASGVAALDKAALDMVRRANPVPKAPENYPAGNLIEFLIPINFEKP